MWIVLLFNLALLAFRVLYVIYYPIDLSPEEAQYWDWSRALDWSYYSKPPMVAYLNFVSTSLLGNTELAVRITPILLSFLLSIASYFFVRKVLDEKSAIIMSTLPQLTVGFSINSILMTTDAPFVFFWSLALMFLYFAIERNTTVLWITFGLFAGLAFLSKYPAVFLLPITLAYLYLEKRELLKDKKIYLSLIPATLLALPVFYWNYRHDFVSFRHVSTLAVKGEKFFNPSHLMEFIAGQVIILSILPFFILLYAWYKSIKDRKLLFFTAYSLPIVLFFMVIALRKKVEANWAGFAYFSAFVLISYYLAKNRLLILLTYCISLFLSALLHFTPMMDTLGITKILPPKEDPVKNLVGWETLGKEVSQIYTGKELIVSPRYQISAELAFYVSGNPITHCINLGRRMNQYDLWKDRVKHMIPGDIIYVDYQPVSEKVLRASDGIISKKEVAVIWRDVEIRRFYVYKLKNYKGTEEEKPVGY